MTNKTTDAPEVTEALSQPATKQTAKPRPARSRYFSLVTYLSEEQIKATMDHYKDYIDSALYILHDKDIVQKTDDTAGDLLKEAHTHILLRSYEATTASAVKKWFMRFRFSDENGLINTMVEICDSVGSARDYLTHKNDPDKYQYSTADVLEFGRGWECFNHASRCADDCLDIIDRLSEGASLRQLVREYGRDFVYNYRAYDHMARLIDRQEICAQMYKDSADWSADNGSKTILYGDFEGRKIDAETYNKNAQIVACFEHMFELMKGR